MAKVKSDILTKINAVARDLTLLTPTPEQRRTKAAFWASFASGDTPVPAEIDLATALRFGANPRLSVWWDIPGFQDWFRNEQEFVQRVEFLAQLALDSVEEILIDKNANPTAKINAVKIVMEMGQKFPGKQDSGKYRDEDIANMSKEELEEFVAKTVPRVLPRA